MIKEDTQKEVLIELRDIKQYFDISTGFFKTKQLKAVDGVSFKIHKGETLGLVGESGCGKTTVGRTIMNLYKPSAGEIIFKGQSIKDKKSIDFFRKRAQMVFQDPYSSLDPRMTVGDIIGEAIDVQKLYSNKKERNKRIDELMEIVGLSKEHKNRYAHEFSGGQRQRISIARALSVNPEFIICDEPVSALDVSIQAQIINMFKKLQVDLGLTYLFIAHDILIVRHVSDRIAVMYLGKIVELAEVDELYDNPLHPYTVSLLSAVPLPDPVLARQASRIILTGDIPSPLDIPSGCPFRTRCKKANKRCIDETPTLKEIREDHYVSCLYIDSDPDKLSGKDKKTRERV